jgi:hypothetical protein
VTYGHHAVWQLASARNGVINHADRDWVDALDRPGARQMIHLRRLMESRPFFTRIPDTLLVVKTTPGRAHHIAASRDSAGTYALLYFPERDQPATIDLSRLRDGGRQLRGWWYDPRSGFTKPIGEITGGGQREFISPSQGPDWVLVLDDLRANYRAPGQR